MQQATQALPDELWALVLSKLTWRGSWRQALPMLLWQPGAGRALQASPHLLAQLLWGREGDEALFCAVANGKADVSAALLQQQHISANGVQKALLAASMKGRLGLIKLLLAHVITGLQKAMEYAALHGQAAALALLVDDRQDAHASIDAAMDVATHHKHIEAMRVLLQRGANAQQALFVAAGRGHEQAVLMLLDAGATVVVGDDAPALFLAALHGYKDTVQLLLDHTEGNIPQIASKVTLEAAGRKGHNDVAEVLLRRLPALPPAAMRDVVRRVAAAGHADIAALLHFHGRVRTRGAEMQLAAQLADGSY